MKPSRRITVQNGHKRKQVLKGQIKNWGTWTPSVKTDELLSLWARSTALIISFKCFNLRLYSFNNHHSGQMQRTVT